jgi:ketosteroid isomerase-like protein
MSRTKTWLDGYLQAWRTKDAADVRAIFTDDAEYWFHPGDPEPVRGIDAIVEMWLSEDEPADVAADLDVLVEDEHIGVIRGEVDYPGHEHYYNLWEVHFAEDGRARRFVEWYMTPRTTGS